MATELDHDQQIDDAPAVFVRDQRGEVGRRQRIERYRAGVESEVAVQQVPYHVQLLGRGSITDLGGAEQPSCDRESVRHQLHGT